MKIISFGKIVPRCLTNRPWWIPATALGITPPYIIITIISHFALVLLTRIKFINIMKGVVIAYIQPCVVQLIEFQKVKSKILATGTITQLHYQH